MTFLGRRKNAAAQGSAGAAATTRERGNAAEDQALAHLQTAGLKMVERNYRTPGRGGGEIDLVMRDRDGTLVFVEVRSRSGSGFGGAGGQHQRHQAAAHRVCSAALSAASAVTAALPL